MPTEAEIKKRLKNEIKGKGRCFPLEHKLLGYQERDWGFKHPESETPADREARLQRRISATEVQDLANELNAFQQQYYMPDNSTYDWLHNNLFIQDDFLYTHGYLKDEYLSQLKHERGLTR